MDDREIVKIIQPLEEIDFLLEKDRYKEELIEIVNVLFLPIHSINSVCVDSNKTEFFNYVIFSKINGEDIPNTAYVGAGEKFSSFLFELRIRESDFWLLQKITHYLYRDVDFFILRDVLNSYKRE